MKKLVFAALAIGAMAACTKSAVQYEQTGEICLQPVAQKATKAAVDGTFYPADEEHEFNVWANWHAVTNEGTSSFGEPYINQGTFSARDLVVWGGKDPKYYWPTTGQLAFAGYSPAKAKDNAEFNYSFTDKTITIKGYTQDTDISQTNDLMWFDFDGNYYTNPGTTQANSVPVTFKHALSWLTFKFNLKESSTPRNWVVKNLTLKGIETIGDFNSANIDSNPKDAWTFAENAVPYEVTVYSQPNSQPKEISYNENPEALENTPNGVLIIPQACDWSNASLVVTYDLKKQGVKDNQGNETYLQDQKVTLDLSVGVDNNKWLPGKHYIYTIIFGANEILISPDVKDWTDEYVNIEVQ